jgi:uncharacterized membrane protein (DUF4010 family)
METSLNGIIVSASLGALIGLIRQWGEQQDTRKADAHFAGLRTFVLWSLIGYAGAYVGANHSPYGFVAVVAVVGLHLVLFSVFGQAKAGTGFTTTAAALITLYVGGLVFWEHLTLAVMLSAITIVVLGLKQRSHSWTRRFTDEDIRSTLQFVAVTGVVLPLVPNQGYGPYEAFNPYSLWLMVVMISGLGFVGYILMRLLGARSGVALAGLVGGLASSTATTLAFSRESKAVPTFSAGFALAIVMACTVMLARVILLLGLIYPKFISALWLPFTILALPGLIYAVWVGLIHRHGERDADLPELKNPLGLGIAVKFALLYAVIAFFVKILSQVELSGGLLALSFLSGLTDMDAIALSVANSLKEGGVAIELATKAVIIAAVANTILKAGLAIALGSKQLGFHITIAMGATVVFGGIAFFLV